MRMSLVRGDGIGGMNTNQKYEKKGAVHMLPLIGFYLYIARA